MLAATSVFLLGFLLWLNFPFVPDPVILIFNRPTSTLTSESLPGQWAMNGGDLQQSRSAGTDIDSLSGQICWSQHLGESTRSGPVVVDGIIYIGGHFKVMAIEATTGRMLWEQPTSGPVNSALTVAGDRLYVGLLDHRLVALSSKNGDLLWDFKTGDIITASPVVANGIVYIGSWDKFIYALDAITGETIWQYRARDSIHLHPALYKGRLYANDASGHLYILNARTGQEILLFRTPGSTTRTPAVDQGLVYFPSGGRIFAVNASAREVPGQFHLKKVWAQFWVWQVPGVPRPPVQAGGRWRFTPDDYATGGITTSLAIADQAFYVGDIQGNFFARAKEDGTPLWQKKVEGAILAPPLVTGTKVIVGTNKGFLYALDRQHGGTIWQLDLESPVEVPPAFAEGHLFVRTADGRLHCVK